MLWLKIATESLKLLHNEGIPREIPDLRPVIGPDAARGTKQ